MRFFLLFLLAFFCSSLFIQPVFAHLPGQPAFLQINGAYTHFYPVLSTSVSNFALPQDAMGQMYIPNQPLHFSIDTSKLIVPLYIVKRSKFYWDFGDSAKAGGLEADHTYTSSGTYLMQLSVNDETTPQNQLLDSVLINVLPDNTYKLPKAVIVFDGQTIHDPLTDTIATNLSLPHILDASQSHAGSSPIVSYRWDLGDGNVTTEKTVTHQYSLAQKHQELAFPFLRVTDKNGYYSDTYVQLGNSTNTPMKPPKVTGVVRTKQTAAFPLQPGGILTFFIILVCLSVGIFIVRKRKS